jgi:hypothetical protein
MGRVDWCWCACAIDHDKTGWMMSEVQQENLMKVVGEGDMRSGIGGGGGRGGGEKVQGLARLRVVNG